MKTMKPEKFVAETWVEWETQASGFRKTRVGKVLGVVLAGAKIGDFLALHGYDPNGCKVHAQSMSSRIDRYVVDTTKEKARGKCQIYAPSMGTLNARGRAVQP